jgi:hypothetical protein
MNILFEYEKAGHVTLIGTFPIPSPNEHVN